jgi:hypothetical protein
MITCSNIIPITLHAINIKENQQLKTIWVNISCIIIASVNLIMWIFVVKRPVMIISIFCTLLQILPLFKNYETIKESLNIQIEILTKLYSNGSIKNLNFLITCTNIIPIHINNIITHTQRSFKTIWVDVLCIFITFVNLII